MEARSRGRAAGVRQEGRPGVGAPETGQVRSVGLVPPQTFKNPL